MQHTLSCDAFLSEWHSVKQHTLVVPFYVFGKARCSCLPRPNLRLGDTLKLTGMWQASHRTHLAHTRRRRVAESRAREHIRRQEAALRAAETHSSPLYST